MTKEIKLTKNQVAIVDDEDYEFLSQWNWRAMHNRYTFYAIRNEYKGSEQKTIYMHREIMKTPDGMHADHRNGNGLDNRRQNLRNCTPTQNKHNCGKYSTNRSGYKGVSWNKNKWKAQITINGVKTFIGRFSNIEDAARAYNEMAQKHYGEFAKTNNVGGTTSK